jgi:glycosyl transferase family 87
VPTLGPSFALSRLQASLACRPYSAAAIILLGILVWPFLTKIDSQWDLVYVAAAERLTTDQDLFVEGYLYPPFMAFAAIPFTWLHPVGSRLAWYLVSVLCLVCLWRWAWRLAGGGRLQEEMTPWQEHVACMIGLACAFRFGIDCLQNHQTDLVIGILLLGGCLFLRDSRVLAAATCFGIAAGMKCTALLWCPYLLWRRQWGAAAWLVLVAFGVNLLPDLVRSPPSGRLWLTEWVTSFLLPMTGSDAKPGTWGSLIVYNQSLAGAGYRAFVADPIWEERTFCETPRAHAFTGTQLKLIVYGGELALVACCGALLWRSRRRTRTSMSSGSAQEPFEYCVVLLLMPLLSPMSSKPHFCTLLFPAFLLARMTMLQRSRILLLLLAGAIAVGVLATKDITGVYVASWMLWHGGVTLVTCFLLAGCLLAISSRVRKQSDIAISAFRPGFAVWTRFTTVSTESATPRSAPCRECASPGRAV